MVENLKVIARTASERIAKFAFDYAAKHGRKEVTAVHQATIHKMADGLFLDCCRSEAARHPGVQYKEMSIDNAMLFLASDPERFDVMVMPNLYGDIVSDLCAGLIGGLGLTPSGNIGSTASVFEAVHGTAPDIAGQDKANPTALLGSAVMMLHHMELSSYAERIQAATMDVINEGKWITGDLGGKASCSEYTRAICDRLD